MEATGEAERQREAAERRLETLKRFFLLFGVLYLGLHFWVTLEAYRQAGFVAATATLVTLGFGDFYWACAWGLASEPVGYVAQAALAATIMAFLSWGARPWTNRYIYRLAADAMPPFADLTDDGGAEPSAGQEATEAAGAGTDARSGGAS